MSLHDTSFVQVFQEGDVNDDEARPEEMEEANPDVIFDFEKTLKEDISQTPEKILTEFRARYKIDMFFKL